jgi:hypothetical protein
MNKGHIQEVRVKFPPTYEYSKYEKLNVVNF